MPTSAEITLHLSPEDGLVAVPAGPGYDWARAVLDLAAFEETYEGIHTLPLSDPEMARRAIDNLHIVAFRFGARVGTTDRPFIGDTARRIAQGLPGTWELAVGHLQLPHSDARQSLDRAWSVPGGPLPVATRSHLRDMPAAAFFSDHAGRELVVVARPWDDTVLVGAIAPHSEFPSLDVRQPASISAKTIPAARAQVTGRLLPSYDRALVEGHRRMLDTVLNGIREARASEGWPDLLPLAAGASQHVPYLLQHLRGSGTRPLSGQSAAALDRAEEVFGAGIPADVRRTARVLEAWLEHGTRIADMIDTLDPHLADTPPPAKTAPALPPGLPGQAAGSHPQR
ncbi:hypothetical protein AB0G74_22240 [Streptomyces sp. NPDC020875]|uniref:hypothetical protein n=1 Tax=Streptomyces sp. NPDC020875 TaxID=3154898 RepID=UPI0033E361C1